MKVQIFEYKTGTRSLLTKILYLKKYNGSTSTPESEEDPNTEETNQ